MIRTATACAATFGWFVAIVWPFGGGRVAVWMASGAVACLLAATSARRWRGRPSGARSLAEGRTRAPSRWLAPAGWTLLLAMALLLPTVLRGMEEAHPGFLSRYWTEVAAVTLLYVVLAMGLNVTVGEAGLFDLGYVAFYAVGAYTYALLWRDLQWGFWTCLPLGGVAAASVGLLVGLPVLRLRGDYLAIVTLGFAQVLRQMLENGGEWTGGPSGVLLTDHAAAGTPRPVWWGTKMRHPEHFYYLLLGIAIVQLVFMRQVLASRIGRAWRAIRDDELAARAMGIHAGAYKLLAFAIGAFWAGTAGVVFAAKQTLVTPSSFQLTESVMILAMVVLGGRRNLLGVVLGAAVLASLPEFLRNLGWEGGRWRVEDFRMLFFGSAMVLVMLVRPQGLLSRRGRA